MKNFISQGPWAPVNIKDFEKMEAEFQRLKGTPDYQAALDQFEGPAHGVDYDEKTGKLRIVNGWHADENGDVVKD